MKTKRNWVFRLDDIREYANKILMHTKDVDQKTFFDDEVLLGACVYWISIIGEAANHVPKSIQKKFPGIPWIDIIGMRNLIVHEYLFLHYDEIWNVIRKDLHVLLTKIEAMKQSLKDHLPSE